MANPRRASGLHLQNFSDEETPLPQQPTPPSRLLSIVVFLKRPHAFLFLLSLFVLLTWVSLRFHNPQPRYSINGSSFPPAASSLSQRESADRDANLVRFSSVKFPSQFLKDKRGWLLNPVTAARDAGISGGAISCASVHVGEIRPGGVRGNHRHRGCNETFILWGAATKFRLENPSLEGGYAEATIGGDEVAVAASPSGRAHAIINIDPQRTTFLLGCQDSLIFYNDSSIDFNIWKGL
ncbi:unnamed protein product [Spirodela intermedia]|uniref:Uncharacterized protein n=1 Tax=Spirodela intermedia TaxID=51605 RepID=A0A7I8IBM7_SPIIN|nr:unnamed protein product [Spirodela intermedia]CAA6654442.1 unnamed protein product [Spirodela intermedia]